MLKSSGNSGVVTWSFPERTPINGVVVLSDGLLGSPDDAFESEIGATSISIGTGVSVTGTSGKSSLIKIPNSSFFAPFLLWLLAQHPCQGNWDEECSLVQLSMGKEYKT